MDEAAITRYITETFDNIETATDAGNTFFFYGPDRMLPLATLVTNDAYDTFSNLDRPSVFRLNVGVGKATYQTLFGSPAPRPGVAEGAGEGESDYDFTALDRVLPHPVYGQMLWICVLNPSDATFESVVRPLLAEAYARALDRHAKRAARG